MIKIPLVLPFHDWPAADKGAWEAALVKGGIFDEGGAFAKTSAGSLRLYRQGYGQWLSYLAREDSASLAEDPVQRVTKGRVQGYIDECLGRDLKLRTIATHLSALVNVLRAFGSESIDWLILGQRRIYRSSNPSQLKKPLPISAEDIFAWAVKRLDGLDKIPLDDPIKQAVAWRQAVMIGIQVACPVRRRAMVAMTVDRHVVQHGDVVLLRWSADDMKDRIAREMPVPEALVSALRAYIQHWRVVLLQGAASPALWISARGNRLGANSYQSGLAKLTEREFGTCLRPHAFRHIAATAIAEKNPAEAGIIRDVLGHATIRTSEMYYNRASMREACMRLQEEVVDKAGESGSIEGSHKLGRLRSKVPEINREEE